MGRFFERFNVVTIYATPETRRCFDTKVYYSSCFATAAAFHQKKFHTIVLTQRVGMGEVIRSTHVTHKRIILINISTRRLVRGQSTRSTTSTTSAAMNVKKKLSMRNVSCVSMCPCVFRQLRSVVDQFPNTLSTYTYGKMA